MAKVIILEHQKGGMGKSTIALNYKFCLGTDKVPRKMP